MTTTKNADVIRNREKSKNISLLKELLPFLAPHKKWLLGAGVALAGATVFTLALPLMFRGVVDGLSESNIDEINQYITVMIGVSIALACLSALRSYLIAWLGVRVVSDIRKAVFSHVSGLSPVIYEKLMTAEVLARLTLDTTIIQGVIRNTISAMLRNGLILFGATGMLLYTSPKLAGITLLIVPAMIVPARIMGRKVRELSRRSQDLIAESTAHAGQMLQAVQTVQAMTYEKHARAGFGDWVEKSFVVAIRQNRMTATMTLVVISLTLMGIAGVLWVGARDVTAGDMSLGAMVQFMLYAAMTAGAVSTLSDVWGALQRAAGATERLVELLNTQDPVHDPATPESLNLPQGRHQGRIDFEDVHFTYRTRKGVPALNGVSFSVAPGETVALVGPSGAGKTTILQMLLRFYDPQSGRILIDGTAIDRIRRTDLRSRIALVPQEPAIFADSVATNIRFGRTEATDAEVKAAARAASADEFVLTLPDGYDTCLGERGVLLSVGQKQRIAIARAILRDAPILLLDEATSALDAENEHAVQQAISTLSKGRATLVIAHRLATVKRADRIVVMDRGQVIAVGTHDALVAEGGLYAHLAQLQFTESLAAE